MDYAFHAEGQEVFAEPSFGDITSWREWQEQQQEQQLELLQLQAAQLHLRVSTSRRVLLAWFSIAAAGASTMAQQAQLKHLVQLELTQHVHQLGAAQQRLLQRLLCRPFAAWQHMAALKRSAAVGFRCYNQLLKGFVGWRTVVLEQQQQACGGQEEQLQVLLATEAVRYAQQQQRFLHQVPTLGDSSRAGDAAAAFELQTTSARLAVLPGEQLHAAAAAAAAAGHDSGASAVGGLVKLWVDDTVKLAGDQLSAAQEQVQVWQLLDIGDIEVNPPGLAQMLPDPYGHQVLQAKGKQLQQQQQQQCMDGLLCYPAMDAQWAGSSSGSSSKTVPVGGLQQLQGCMQQPMHVQSSSSSLPAAQWSGVQQHSSKQLSLNALDSASCLQDLQDALMHLM
jgi:hypothetical protein